MRPTAKVEGVATAADETLSLSAHLVKGGMVLAAEGLQAELREQVLSAGLGQRLANTWRAKTYPEGRDSLSPAAWVWSNAPEIIDSFDRGATIRPVAGGQYLWLPTENTPRDRNAPRGSQRKAGPDEVELQFNQDLIIRPGKGGNLLVFVRAIRGKNGRGARQATPRRLAQGRSEDLILMFNLVPLVSLPKDLDVQGGAEKWAGRVQSLIGGA